MRAEPATMMTKGAGPGVSPATNNSASPSIVAAATALRGMRLKKSGLRSATEAKAKSVVMLAVNEMRVTMLAGRGLSRMPESRMEERNVSMLQAQKNAMPT